MPGTLVFIPAWNEEASLPAVIAGAQGSPRAIGRRLVEVPVHMRAREHGESSFHGRRAVELVVTIGLMLFAAKLLRQRHEHRRRRDVKRVLRAARPRPSRW